MATYKEVIGTSITNIAGNSPTTVNGDIWYNSSATDYKFNTVLPEAWATGGNLTTARRMLGGAGTQTAGLAFGGDGPSKTNTTEEYNGSSWTNGGNMGTAKSELGGTGTQTAGLAFGGD